MEIESRLAKRFSILDSIVARVVDFTSAISRMVEYNVSERA